MSAGVRHMVGRLRQIAAEIDYAQRRMLELRTGIPFTPETERAVARAEVAGLEALYAQPDREREPAGDVEPDCRDEWSLRPPART
jgi:hypothetical protein